MSPCTLVRALPNSKPKRIHPFVQITEEENSMEAVETADRLSNPSAKLLTASLDVMLSAYSNIPSVANSNSKWLDDGLEDIVKLLDMCNAVSDNIAEMKRYERLLHTTIHSLDHVRMDIGKMSQTPLLIRAANLLADCRRAVINGDAKSTTSTSRSRGMVTIEEVIGSSNSSRISRSEGEVSEDMRNLNECTTSVLKTVARALSVELPRPSLHAQRDPHVIVGCCFRLRSLFKRVMNHNRSKDYRCLLHELVSADVLVRKLFDLLAEKQQKKEPTEVKELVEELKKCRVDLDHGISEVDNKIKELYSALIRSRVALLDIQTYSL